MINNGCINSKKNAEWDLTLKYNSQKLKKTKQVLYSKFCLECHFFKGVADNFLVGNIRNDYGNWNFLIAYINRRDSLLQHKNELTAKLKDEYNNIDYLHQFHLSEQEIKSIIHYLKN